MNLDFLKDLGRQLAKIWSEIKTYQKFTVIVVVATLLAVLSFLVVNAASTKYTLLFPTDRLAIADAAEVKNYLEGMRVNYKLRGSTAIMVPEEDVHKLRMDLAAAGLPKLNGSKGFELFDTNTWIKGEKELQVLEMRALMGQLQRDIGEYENIKDAHVILDLAPPRPFGGSIYKAKASVILDLMPGARINQSQLRAITFHVAGAVRGLTPNMVAISDTSGNLYQGLDPNGEIDLLRASEVAHEERLKSKIDSMLALVVGHGNFYSTVQVTMNRNKQVRERKIFSGQVDGVNLGEAVVSSVTEQGLQMTEVERAERGSPGTTNEAVAGAILGAGGELMNRDEQRNSQYRQMAVPIDHITINSTPGQISSISIGVLIDKTITIDTNADIPQTEIQDGKRNASVLKAEIENQLAKIVEGYNIKAIPAVDFVEFDKTKFNEKVKEETWVSMMDNATAAASVLFVLFTVLGMFWTFNRFWKRNMLTPPALENDDEDSELDLVDEPTIVEVEAMIESIKTRFQNDPNAVVETVREWIAEESFELASKE
jgi:flagellar M-ring protein FliF